MYKVETKYSEDFKNLNNCKDEINIFGSENKAIQYINNEVDFQINNDSEWSCKYNDDLSVDIYYCGEWQYTMRILEKGE